MPYQAIAVSPYGDIIHSLSLRQPAPPPRQPIRGRVRSTSASASTQAKESEIEFRTPRIASESHPSDTYSSQDELCSSPSQKEEAYTCARNFSVNYDKINSPPEIILAERISSRPQGTIHEEATFIADQAEKLGLPDSDFFSDIVRFLHMRGEQQVLKSHRQHILHEIGAVPNQHFLLLTILYES